VTPLLPQQFPDKPLDGLDRLIDSGGDGRTEAHHARFFVTERFRLASDEQDALTAAAERFHHAQHLRWIKFVRLEE
jgi:hypothetical protein